MSRLPRLNAVSTLFNGSGETMIYIGIDVSMHLFCVASFHDASRGKVKAKAFKNQASNFGAIVDWRDNKTSARSSGCRGHNPEIPVQTAHICFQPDH